MLNPEMLLKRSQKTEHPSVSFKSLSYIANNKKSLMELAESENKANETAKDIRYIVTLTWKEEMIQRSRIEGKVNLIIDNNIDTVQQAVLNDLELNGFIFQNPLNMITKIRRQKITLPKNINEMSKQTETLTLTTQVYIECIIVQFKVRLPKGYSHSPENFPGFIVPNFSVRNSHGCITWLSPINVSNIDFDETLSILQEQVVIQSLELRNCDFLVEFFKLPKCVESKISQYGESFGRKALIKCVKKLGNSARMVQYCEWNKHWFVHFQRQRQVD